MNLTQALLFFCGSALLLSACGKTEELEQLKTVFETSEGTETATYAEGIAWWKALEEASPYIRLKTFGETDAGLPLHVVIVNTSKNFSREKIQERGKTILLINNGIHPGEPDGIDASMLFVRDLLMDEQVEDKLKNTVLLIIPFYNIGGALNRNCCSRANQNGPASYGFRGNARNLDLNRDFIKCDSKNARSFSALFSAWNPDVYLETHVSNGADYPYTMTYLASHPDKLTPPLSHFVEETLSPELFERMADQGDEMIPYVNVFGTSPDAGYTAFYDTPRYSTGYAALHHSIGLLTETHMLKPYDQRVASTRRFLHTLTQAVQNHGEQIQALRTEAQTTAASQTTFTLDWEADSARVSKLRFKGYRAYFDTSEVTGQPQLYYDREQPWDHDIPYYNHLKPSVTVHAPAYYVVPAAWYEVVERLRLNGVNMTLMEKDTVMKVEAYEINSTETSKTPYEGHYVHHHTLTESQFLARPLLAHTYYLVPTDQTLKRFIIETLEPRSPDSYFNWNFYDEIMQQKEWFSPYVFDNEAKKLLEDPSIRASFEEMRDKDPTFSLNAFSQLYYLYRNSDHYERERHMIYPVFRVRG